MEYAIMLPILILQVLLLPLSTSWIMTLWVDSRMHLELQDVANHMSSTLQQLYFSFNSEDTLPGTMSHKPEVPAFIESYPYYAIGMLRATSQANFSKILDIHLALQGKDISANSSTTFGPNVKWQTSIFRSNSSTSLIRVQKFPNGTFLFSFG